MNNIIWPNDILVSVYCDVYKLGYYFDGCGAMGACNSHYIFGVGHEMDVVSFSKF